VSVSVLRHGLVLERLSPLAECRSARNGGGVRGEDVQKCVRHDGRDLASIRVIRRAL
jgi:hypothetical protein